MKTVYVFNNGKEELTVKEENGMFYLVVGPKGYGEVVFTVTKEDIKKNVSKKDIKELVSVIFKNFLK